MEEQMQLEAIIFDLFGTLVDFRFSHLHHLLATMADHLQIPFDCFIEHWSTGYVMAETTNSWRVEDQLWQIAQVLSMNPDPKGIVILADTWRQFQQDLLRPTEEVLNTLRELRALGLKLGLLSNCPPDVPAFWPQAALAPLFDATCFSCDTAVRNPDAQSYHLICRRLRVVPQHALFVGDGGSRELSGAIAAGLRAWQLRLPDDDPMNDQELGRESWTGPSISALEELVTLFQADHESMNRTSPRLL